MAIVQVYVGHSDHGRWKNTIFPRFSIFFSQTMFIGSVSDFTRPRGVYNHSKWYPSDVLEVFQHLEVRKHLLMTARGSQRIGNFTVISTWKGSQYLVWTDFWWFSPINHTFCPAETCFVYSCSFPASYNELCETGLWEKTHKHYIQRIFEILG